MVMSMSHESTLGKRLQELRVSSCLSQEALAEILHVSRETVRNWESGHCEPPISVITELARLYHVSADLILGISDIRVIRLDRLTEEQAEVISLLVSTIEARAKHSIGQ